MPAVSAGQAKQGKENAEMKPYIPQQHKDSQLVEKEKIQSKTPR